MLRLVLGQSMRPVVLGMALGMALTAGVSRVLKALLFGVSALDPVVFASVSVLLAVWLHFFASYVPARRAAKVDPMVALGCE